MILGNFNNAIFPTYIDGQKYIKGDRIFLKPTNEDVQVFPTTGGGGGTRINFMGKSITYSTQSIFTEYPFRIRAKVDNPGDPRIASNFASDWAVDDPSAIVEKGSNSNGEYIIYADGNLETFSRLRSFNRWAVGRSNFIWTFPIVFLNNNVISKTTGITYYGAGSGDMVTTYETNFTLGGIYLCSAYFDDGSNTTRQERYVLTGTGYARGTSFL